MDDFTDANHADLDFTLTWNLFVWDFLLITDF